MTDAHHLLVDHRLYLPNDWANDPDRRELTHVPDHVTFQEKWRLALDLLDRCGPVLPHGWVTGDDELGRPSAFRSALRFRHERYVLDVPCDTRVRPLDGTGAGFQRVDAWARSQPGSAWQERPWRAGEKGPVRVQVLSQRVQTMDDTSPGPSEPLLVIRTLDGTPKTWYCLSNAKDVSTDQLVSARAKHHRVERGLQAGKGEAGLGHYEVRSWVGWHHHMTLSLLALWFLVLERGRVKKNGRDKDPANPRDLHPIVAPPGSESETDRRGSHPSTTAQRRNANLSLASGLGRIPATAGICPLTKTVTVELPTIPILQQINHLDFISFSRSLIKSDMFAPNALAKR